jgi:hypothetical protein
MADPALPYFSKKKNNYFLTKFPPSITRGTMIEAGIYFADFPLNKKNRVFSRRTI